MKGLKQVFVVINREHSEDVTDLLRKNNASFILTSLCVGTATNKNLELLGIARSQKVMIKSVLFEDEAKRVLNDIHFELRGDGNGIAFFTPTDGFGGESSLKVLVGEDKKDKAIKLHGEIKMENISNYVLITAIVDAGNSGKVMDSARQAGAGGGTVANANGTGKDMEKFFGVSFSDEKEVIYIISRRNERDAIMRAIMDMEGFKTQMNGVVYALPVEAVSGIKAYEND